jgi:hypothetical protein
MDDRTTPPEATWPVSLASVLDALRDDDEMTIDLGTHGVLHLRWSPPVTSGPDVVSGRPELAERTRTVLAGVASGLPAALVAENLRLTIGEVADELRVLRERYGVSSTASAIEAAKAAGDV